MIHMWECTVCVFSILYCPLFPLWLTCKILFLLLLLLHTLHKSWNIKYFDQSEKHRENQKRKRETLNFTVRRTFILYPYSSDINVFAMWNLYSLTLLLLMILYLYTISTLYYCIYCTWKHFKFKLSKNIHHLISLMDI